MELITSIEKIHEYGTSIRNLKKGFITNFYLSEPRHQLWIDKNTFFYEYIGNTCFFVKEWESFTAVFYNAASKEDLEKDIVAFKNKYDNKSLIFDVVGRMEQCQSLLPLFYDCGFVDEISLVRFLRINTPVESTDEIMSVQKANHDQVVKIHQMLHYYLNERTEQIPYLEELIEWSDLGHVLVFLDGDKIAGFFDYEKNNTTLIPRHWVVHHEYRGKHIGSILYHRLLWEANDTKRILSWVLRNNTVSIISHHHYGFKEENMFDFVLTNKPLK